MNRISFLAAIICVHAAVAQAQSQALALTWKGYADTDLNFSEFFPGDHTLALRFMAQFPNAYEGPMIAENGGGTFVVGQGDVNAGTPSSKLYFAVGSHAVIYGALLQPGQWRHLAIVATHTSIERIFTFYLDGAR